MITCEEFFRNKIKENIEWEGSITLSKVPLNAELAMRWAFEYAEQFKEKSDKWDELSNELEMYYDEEHEDFDEDAGLLEIGETCAQAFGYI